MSLSKFKTFLYPRTKNANIGFYKKYENDTEDGEVLEAGFSRVDAGDTSGATVFRNGQLIELAENEPDWDDLSGSPVLKMRPQAQNRFANFDPITGEGGAVNVTYAAKDWGLGLLLQNATEFLVTNPSPQIRHGGTCVGAVNTISFYVEFADGLAPVIGTDISARISDEGISAANTIVENVSGTSIYRIIATKTNCTDGSPFNGVTRASGSTRSFVASGYTLVQGDKYLGDIPSKAGQLTRSSNSFEFTDLVTKGVIGAGNVFSLYYEYKVATLSDGFLCTIQVNGNNFIGLRQISQRVTISFRSNAGSVFTLTMTGVQFALGNVLKVGLVIDPNNANTMLISVNGVTRLTTAVDISAMAQLTTFTSKDGLGGIGIANDIIKSSLVPIRLTEAQINAATA